MLNNDNICMINARINRLNARKNKDNDKIINKLKRRRRKLEN